MKNLMSIIEYAVQKYEGKFRKGNLKIPYINHSLKICNELYRLNITSKPYTANDLSNIDYIMYTVALLHDVLEENSEMTYELLEKDIGTGLASKVQQLTFYPVTNNPFAKSGYLYNLCHTNNDVFIIKIIDRLCNVKEFILNENKKYANIYFHKADILFNELFNRVQKDKSLMKVWEEVIKVQNELIQKIN